MIARKVIESDEAHRSRSEHRFVHGKGYLKLRPLRMPTRAQAPASACEPAQGAATGSVHVLQPPNEAPVQSLTWDAEKREWLPPLGRGRRIGFSSTYLAAHGWSYVSVADADR